MSSNSLQFVKFEAFSHIHSFAITVLCLTLTVRSPLKHMVERIDAESLGQNIKTNDVRVEQRGT